MESARIPSAAEADAYVDAVVRRSGTSFLAGMRVLPEAERRAMYAVYAFCREIDDVADDPGREADKRRHLADWRAEIGRLYAGRPVRPVGVALLDAVGRYGLKQVDFEALIEGMEIDSADRVRIADDTALARYCDRVAGAVGRLSVRIFGLPEAEGEALASALGEALQLTNILRDVEEDAERDRVYLPATLLLGHGLRADDPAALLRAPGLDAACRALADRARARFAEAAAALTRCDRRRARPARLMMEVYRRVLERLEQRGWQAGAARVRPSKVEIAWIVLRHGLAWP